MMKEEDLKSYLKELEEVINIESPTSSPEGVNKVADFFIKKANELGLQSKKIPAEGAGDCLLVSNNLDLDTYDLLIVGHMDTVFPIGHIKEAPFKVEGNIIKGPGVIDDKGCVLMSFYALKYLDLSKFSFLMILNSAEEVGSKPTDHIIRTYGAKGKLAFVLEPARSNGAMVASRKGVLRKTISFEGIASHSGNEPEKGRSAVAEAAHFISTFATMNNYEEGYTFNSVFYESPTALNVVPDKASIGIEIRYVKDSSLKLFEDKINYLLANPLIADIKVSQEITGNTPPMFDETGETKRIQAIINQEAEKLGITNLSWVDAGGGSDGNFISAEGVATVDGLGVIGGNMHSKDEYMELDSVIPRCNLLINTIKTMFLK